jgi:ribosomal protein S12 methylthiotransferase
MAARRAGHHDSQHLHRRLPRRDRRRISKLLDWLREAQLDRVGCFEYSPVEGAAANAPGSPGAGGSQAERRARFMELAAEISAQRLAQKVGRTMQVLIDRSTAMWRSPDRPATRRRSTAPCEFSAPRRGIAVGHFATCKITGAGAYDLETRALIGPS